MYQCTFKLNNQPMSVFKVGATSFLAFSGIKPYVNMRTAMCVKDNGPIPPGTYYIVDRESGGRLESIYKALGWHGDWFSLHADDGKIDDEVFCESVKRNHFRLHPAGLRRISRGCITIETQSDFNYLRAILLGTKKEAIPGSALLAYGKVVVT